MREGSCWGGMHEVCGTDWTQQEIRGHGAPVRGLSRCVLSGRKAVAKLLLGGLGTLTRRQVCAKAATRPAGDQAQA
jgi:hypothetical protein